MRGDERKVEQSDSGNWMRRRSGPRKRPAHEQVVGAIVVSLAMNMMGGGEWVRVGPNRVRDEGQGIH